MRQVLVLSSFVAASRVGGGVAAFVFPPLGVDPVLVPTTLLGRHPGWGPPGGGAVEPDTLAGMLEGIEANGLFGQIDAVLTGYFATPAQVQVAAGAIERIRGAVRSKAPPLVVVDPIMGDADVGYYVSREVAAALARELVPRADLVACNLWEFRELTDASGARSPEMLAGQMRGTGRDWLVSSVATETGIGAVISDGSGSWHAETMRHARGAPRGAGDLLKARFLAGEASGEARDVAVSRAVGLVGAIIERAIAMEAAELPLAACADLLARAPEARIRQLHI